MITNCYNDVDGSCMQDGLPDPEDRHSTRISIRGAKRVELPQRSLRINLQDLKAKLSKVLGPKKEKEYCTLFSSFLSQRLTKAELDESLTQTIGRDNISLHNQIVRAVLSNALRGEPPPTYRSVKRRQESVKSIEGTPSTSEEEDSQVSKRAKLDAEEVHQVKEREILPPIGIPFCPGSVGVPVQWKHAPQPWNKFTIQDDVLPDNATMQRRMEKPASEAGLDGVNQDCAVVLNQALDVHLKRIIGSCVEILRSRRSNKGSTSVQDFQLAVEQNPQVLGDRWSLHLERISLLAFEQQRHKRFLHEAEH